MKTNFDHLVDRADPDALAKIITSAFFGLLDDKALAGQIADAGRTAAKYATEWLASQVPTSPSKDGPGIRVVPHVPRWSSIDEPGALVCERCGWRATTVAEVDAHPGGVT